MPTYEYLCGKCKRLFDVIRPMAQATDPAACPECETYLTTRVFHGIALLSRGRITTRPAVPRPVRPRTPGGPGFVISNVAFHGFATDVRAGPGTRIISRSSQYSGRDYGIESQGEVDSEGDTFD